MIHCNTFQISGLFACSGPDNANVKIVGCGLFGHRAITSITW